MNWTDPNLILAVIAAFNAITAIIGWMTHRAITEAKIDIRKVELATNSMKDQLVAATALASEAKGRDEERIRSDDRAKGLLKEKP